jgi:uncharacterized membrane protein
LKRPAQIYESLRFRLKTLANFVEEKAQKIVYIFIGIYTIVFSGYTIFMHYAFKTYAWDLGIYTQSLWSTLNLGKPFYYTIESQVNPSQNFFGVHFSPILILITPIYALYQSPITLLVLQSFILGLSALPIYWIAQDKLESKLWGLTFAAAFLLHPALHGINCFDFHTESFIPLFFLLTFYYLEKGKWFKGFIFALLTLSTIEFAPILIWFLGIYFLIKMGFRTGKISFTSFLKQTWFSVVLIALSVFFFFLSFYVLYNINSLKSIGLPGNWDIWGNNLGEVVINVLRNPILALGDITNPIEKIYYILLVFAPTCLLAFLSPLELLLTAPWLLAALLSNYPPYYEPYFQYFGFVAGQVFIAAVYGVRKLANWHIYSLNRSIIEKRLMALILVLSLVTSVTISPIGLSALTRKRVEINSHTETLHEVLKLIPTNASVGTQDDILPHLAQRENIFILTWPMKVEADFILVDLKSSHFRYGPFATSLPPDLAFSRIIDEGNYGIMAYADGVILLKKNYTGEYLYKPYQASFDYEDLWTYRSTSYVTFDPSSNSGRIIVHDTRHVPGVVWYGPYVYLFKGNFSAIFKIRTKSANINLTLDVFCEGETICERDVTFSDFDALDRWQELTLNFTINNLKRMEFRGICRSNNTYVALDFVKIIQLGP